MPRRKLAYKVVAWSSPEGPFVSRYARGKAQVRYAIGEVSKPPDWLTEKGHGLFAYDTLEQAVYSFGERETILECEAGKKMKSPEYYELEYLAKGETWRALIVGGSCTATKYYEWLKPVRIVSSEEKLEALRQCIPT